MYGIVTDLARKYLVSRWCIYGCYTQFLLLLELQREPQTALTCPASCYDTLEERVLSVYLETEASFSGIRRVMLGSRKTATQIFQGNLFHLIMR